MPLEEFDLQDAEESMINRPHGGIVDRIIAEQMLKMGWDRSWICEAFGRDPFIPSNGEAIEELARSSFGCKPTRDATAAGEPILAVADS